MRKQLNVEVDARILQAFRELCEAAGISQRQAVEELLRQRIRQTQTGSAADPQRRQVTA